MRARLGVLLAAATAAIPIGASALVDDFTLGAKIIGPINGGQIVTQSVSLDKLPTAAANTAVMGPCAGQSATQTSRILCSSDVPVMDASMIQNLVMTGMDNRIVNPEFSIDQGFEGTTATPASNGIFVTDHWFHLQTQASKFSFVRSTSSPPTGYSYSELITTASAVASPGASDQWTFTQKILGSDIADFAAFGTASAPTLQFEFMAKASAAGTYCTYLHNNGRTRSYVAEFTIAANNTWQTVQLTIPGDTSGTWASIPSLSTYGLEIGFDLGAGSTFQTTAGAWQTGSFSSTSNCTGLVKTGAATLNLTRVRLYQGSVALPYVPRPYGLDLLLAQRFLQKGFALGVLPANGSASGLPATCTIIPSAIAYGSVTINFSPSFIAGAPTLTTYNPANGQANANFRDITAAADVTVAANDTTNAISSRSALIKTNATVANAGDEICIQWKAVKEI